MSTYPFFIIRVSGGDFKKLNSLQSQESYSSTIDLIIKKKNLTIISSKLCDILYKKVSAADSKNERHLLIEAKRNIFNNRTLTPEGEKTIRKCGNQQEISLLNTYIDLSHEISHKQEKIAKLFNYELKTGRNEINELSKEENFKCGLLLSSYDFYKLVKNKYWNTHNSNRNSSYNSIEEGIAKYISRMYTKTSPFSTFTHIGFGEIKSNINSKNKFLSTANKISRDCVISKIRTNQYLFKYLYILLSEIPAFVEHFNISLNHTVRDNDDSIQYFTNKGNTESIQVINKNQTIFAIYNYLLKKEYKFINLQDFILDNSNSNKKQAQVFIKRLVNIGFLDYNIDNIQGTDPTWHIKLTGWLESISIGTPLQKELIEMLVDLEASIELFHTADSSQREKILAEIFERYKTTCGKLKKATSLETFPDEVDNTSESEFYEYKTSKNFPFEVHQMFYEDSKYSVFSKMDIEVSNNIVGLLDKCLQWLIPYEGHHMDKNNITSFFLDNYEEDQKVNLLSFYEKFQKFKARSNFDSKSDRGLALFFYERFEPINKDYISIDYESFTKDLEKRIGYLSAEPNLISSHSAFLQLFNEDGRSFAVVNGIYPGFGKMFSRFLYLQDDLIKGLREENKSHLRETIWAEDRDSSFFNANIHPPLMPFEIAFPGSHNSMRKEKRIPITSLAIKYDDSRKRLNLSDKKTDKTVYVFDLCFQTQSGRSDLFQFLERFTLEQYLSFGSLFIEEKIKLQKRLKEQRDNNKFEILTIPRVDVNNKIIIQRKSWFVPKELLPVKENNESQSSYFIRANEWRLENKLPKELFIYLVYPKERLELDDDILNNLSRDAYKPQYISFDTPFFLEIFSSACKKVPRTLKITEMIPNSSQLLQYGQEKRVTEFIVQWNSKNNI